ncbi:MAG: hypothetical protein PIR53_14505 [Nocardioides alkalitolerans]
MTTSSPPAEPLRVLFCFGINQNFFDLPTGELTSGDVWTATLELLAGLRDLPGLDVIADIDDDAHMVGPSDGWPWTFYVLADAADQGVVKAACNLLRTIRVGGTHQLWRFMKVEARMGRPLTPRSY